METLTIIFLVEIIFNQNWSQQVYPSWNLAQSTKTATYYFFAFLKDYLSLWVFWDKIIALLMESIFSNFIDWFSKFRVVSIVKCLGTLNFFFIIYGGMATLLEGASYFFNIFKVFFLIIFFQSFNCAVVSNISKKNMYSLVSLLSGICPILAMYSLLVTLSVTRYKDTLLTKWSEIPIKLASA